MNLYWVCGSTLASNILLTELPPASGHPEWCFTMMPAPSERPFEGKWFHHWELPDGQAWLQIGREQTGYLLRFPSLADFEITQNGYEIRCYPSDGTPAETLKHLLLDQVLPLLLSKRRKLVLHASAVTGPGGSFAFTGGSGQGKSTLAASFSLDGYELLTDDCLVVEDRDGGIFGTPVYPALRLYPEVIQKLFTMKPASSPVSHYSSKQRLGLEDTELHFHTQPVRLNRIYILDSQSGDAPVVSMLSPREAFLQIVKFAFLMDVDDPGELKIEFENISRTATLPLFRRLSYPRDFNLLPSVRREILRDAFE